MSPSQLFRIDARAFEVRPLPTARWDDTVALASLAAFVGMIVFLLVR